MEKQEAVVFPMNGGSGLHRYARNSTVQVSLLSLQHQNHALIIYLKNSIGNFFVLWRNAVELATQLINKGIAEKLELSNFASSKTFRVADLGCSVGPNTFLAVQNIVDSVEHKYKRQALGHLIPEFQVFFNDHVSNDFSQHFASLPPKRRYYATGVPGSFYDRLFPNSSLYFLNSSFAAQWLSEVPKELVDKTSPSSNKGRIHYSNSSKEVVECYEAQFSKDMHRFLNARAQDIMHGGFMALVLPACPDGTPHSQVLLNKATELLGVCLVDMAKRIDEEIAVVRGRSGGTAFCFVFGPFLVSVVMCWDVKYHKQKPVKRGMY
ncbi:hypothetical protein FNV43_RR19981 [Rhamnella rubrinervis]|uniref:S-adenosylmethionine-dependent methyltransferase n=1 Tax=Rhamnella rubrinervis TaxID=2594499 RepID=A0A8K0DXV7_9ROSA|nr:hypothetical protein FNV43_RR19981 [Rhamnella rubrinervis]